MWCRADDQECSNGSDAAGCYPMEVVKGPATLSTEGRKKFSFLMRRQERIANSKYVGPPQMVAIMAKTRSVSAKTEEMARAHVLIKPCTCPANFMA